MIDSLDAFAIAAPGLAPLVAAELTAIGITPVEVSDAGVSFAGTVDDIAWANLWLRTATRVIVRLATFEAVDFATLERKARTVPWSRVLRDGADVQLRVTCRKSRLYHSDAVAQRVARGIELKIARSRVALKAENEEKESDNPVPAHAGITTSSLADATQQITHDAQLIIIRFDHDICTISADSSGELLHRRGWRQAIAKAPLRETLAAALITASGWKANTPLVDPFGGSGTIGIEAALRARNIAPGIARTFAMESWNDVNAGMFAELRAEARNAAKPGNGIPIIVADRDAGACRAAVANAERAGVGTDVTVIQRALSATHLNELGTNGHVITNPPYGVRVSEGNDLRSLYQRLGDVVRAGGAGWHVTMLAAERSLVAQTRLGTVTKIRTTNGGLPVTIDGN